MHKRIFIKKTVDNIFNIDLADCKGISKWLLTFKPIEYKENSMLESL